MRYFKCNSVSEVLMLLVDEETHFPIIAGGTDILVQWRMNSFTPEGIIDIGSIEELKIIVEGRDHVEIGALATHTDIIESRIVERTCPVLVEACKAVGARQIQNRGTIGGNIVTASPAADLPPILLAFDAELELKSLSGTRRVPIRDFYISYRKTALEPDEILTKIILPRLGKDEFAKFYKLGTRKAQSIAKASLCARTKIASPSPPRIEDISIALGSVAPIPVRVPKAENFLKGKTLSAAVIEGAKKILSDEIKPIDDIRSTASYRQFAAGSLLGRYLADLLQP